MSSRQEHSSKSQKQDNKQSEKRSSAQEENQCDIFLLIFQLRQSKKNLPICRSDNSHVEQIKLKRKYTFIKQNLLPKPEEEVKTLEQQLSQGELKKVLGEGRLDEYGEEEEEIECLRFPHLKFCPHNYQQQLRETIFIEVLENVYLCGFATGLATKFILSKGITHILNVTAIEYTKRTKYFKYLTLDIYNTSEEDIKKHFRITNRFLRECLLQRGKVLVHSNDGINIGPCFLLAYMINSLKIPLKIGIEQFKQIVPQLEIAQHFIKQLEQYDLEKLALVQLKKQEL